MGPDRKTKYDNSFMKLDLPVSIAGDFDCKKKPVDEPQKHRL